MANKILLISVFFMLFVQCSKKGCSDANALNYDSKVTKDDGSCVYVGCNDPDAFNYNPIATSVVASKHKPIIEERICPRSSVAPNSKDAGINVIIAIIKI